MNAPKKIILCNYQSPGDIVMLTAAVRDLSKGHPQKYHIDVRTTGKALWQHNPYLTPLSEDDPEVEVIECHYPLIHKSNTGPWHFVHGFTQFLAERLGVEIVPTVFKGDIHLSSQEKSWMSQVQEITQENIPFWIIVAGGKNDFTIKWWSKERFQSVVDHFKGKILFVQVGEKGHAHPSLNGVLDLRGKTDLRQLIRLVYHAQGVLCPVTLLMHLAAAVETKSGMPKSRPCVVVAGGREPYHWEAYPQHQFIHTNGALSCCDNGGCWKSRTYPLEDGDEKDKPNNLCVDVVDTTLAVEDSEANGERRNALQFSKQKWPALLPQCMDLITSEEVIRRIELYFRGGAIQYLSTEEAKIASNAIKITEWRNRVNAWLTKNDVYTAKKEANRSVARKKRIATDHNPPTNGIEIRVVGMRRSGLHAIINWIAALFPDTGCFVNDVNHNPNITFDTTSSHLASLAGNFSVSLNATKNVLLHSYEDCSLGDLEELRMPDVLTGVSAKQWDVLILRDPFNMLASRLALSERDPENVWVKALMMEKGGEIQKLMQLWTDLAHEYLEIVNGLKENAVAVNFNRWHSDAQYRVEIANQFGVRSFTDNREFVLHYGFGSSFDELKYDGKASTMDISNRWQKYRKHPSFHEMLECKEIIDLTRRIFGDDICDALDEKSDLIVESAKLACQ